MPDPFQILDGPTDANTVVLRLVGRMDSAAAPLLAQRCATISKSGRTLVLNMEGVTFIVSSGVGSLLAAAEGFRQAGCQLHLVALPPSVASVIRLLNLHKFLPIHATEADAMTALKAA